MHVKVNETMIGVVFADHEAKDGSWSFKSWKYIKRKSTILKAFSIRNHSKVSTRRHNVWNMMSKDISKFNYINKVTLLGRVGNYVKKCDTKPCVVHFPIATYENHKYITGEVYRTINWHKVCVYDPVLQEYAINNIEPGHRIYVTGTLGIAQVQMSDGLVHTDIVVDAEKFVCIKNKDDEEQTKAILDSYSITVRNTRENDAEDLDVDDYEKSEKVEINGNNKYSS